MIPANRIDPTSKVILGDLWKPNNAGTGPTGVNNFLAGYANRFKYWNFLTAWTGTSATSGRCSAATTSSAPSRSGTTSPAAPGAAGGWLQAPFDQLSGDAVYTLNATTVLNFRAAYNAIVDSFGVPDSTLKESDLERFWPGNPWYKPYLATCRTSTIPASPCARPRQPRSARPDYWFQEPNSWNIESKMSKNIGRHYVKVGGEFRKETVNAARPRPMSFDFRPESDRRDLQPPRTRRLNGDAWATFLLGALDENIYHQFDPDSTAARGFLRPCSSTTISSSRPT